MFTILLLGLASGIPLGVLMTLLQAFLKSGGIDIKTLGLISLVQLPYTLKFCWAPLVDRFSWPVLGRRRGWMLFSQIGLVLCTFTLGRLDPQSDLCSLMVISVILAVFGATHDIVIDAFRRDILQEDELGFGSALASNSYLVGFRFIAGAIALILADQLPWTEVFLALSVITGVGIIGTFIAPINAQSDSLGAPTSILQTVYYPFKDYLQRNGAIEILIFILLYKVGDNFAANLTLPFYLDIGFTKTEVGAITKLFGFWATFAGGLLGGVVLFRWNIRKCLLWFGILQMLSTFGFSWMNEVVRAGTWDKNLVLTMVICFENVSAGMGSAAFAAFMLRLTNKKFSATQFALLTSLMSIPRVVIPAAAGYVAEPLGWTGFFIFSGLIAVPGLVMIFTRAKKWEEALPNA